MHAEPGRPAERSGEPAHEGDLRDRGVAADRGHRAEVRVRELRARLSPDVGGDGLRDGRAGLDRGLRELGEGLVLGGDVAGGVHPRHALDLQVVVHGDAAAPVLRQAPPGDRLGDRDAGGPDGDVGLEDRTVVEDDVVVADLLHAVAEAQHDPAVAQLVGGVLAVLVAELLEQLVAALQHRELQGPRIHLGIEDVQLLHAEVRQGAGDLHARRPAADDADVELVVGDAGLAAGALELGEDPVADGEGLRARVHRHRMLLGTGGAEVGGGRAVGEHQVVVGELLIAALALVERDDLPLRVDADHLALAIAHVGDLQREAAQEHGDVARVQTSGRHLVQQRLEGLVDVAVDQGDAHAGVAQAQHGVGTGESTAHDDHVGPARAVPRGDRGTAGEEGQRHGEDS